MKDPNYRGILNTVAKDMKLIDQITDPKKLKAAQKLLKNGKGYKLFKENDATTQAVVLGILKQLEAAEDTKGIRKANRSFLELWNPFKKSKTKSERVADSFLENIWKKGDCF